MKVKYRLKRHVDPFRNERTLTMIFRRPCCDRWHQEEMTFQARVCDADSYESVEQVLMDTATFNLKFDKCEKCKELVDLEKDEKIEWERIIK